MTLNSNIGALSRVNAWPAKEPAVVKRYRSVCLDLFPLDCRHPVSISRKIYFDNFDICSYVYANRPGGGGK